MTESIALILTTYVCQVFFEKYEDHRPEVDSLLLTATLCNLESTSKLLPRPGLIVDINDYTSLQAYGGNQCQLTTRLSNLTWEGQ